MKNVFISDRIAKELPEWVPYLLWYAIGDMNVQHGTRQMFELSEENGMQRIRHTQTYPAYENVVVFPVDKPIHTVIVVRFGETETVMMLEQEESEHPV
ncbi:DUF960 family protein [Agathobaculum desmolans]|mgnify:FL=1